ncbi:hypothetical protein [uncultured Amnibacterium sp.]|uniref:hypothetical protein n=1 Tax=uncultured Amnibacterium sp. TaxID=1631851 RepID=UPI0035CB2E3B
MATISLPFRARRTWFDPRVAIGVALVVVSVLGVVGVVAASDRTQVVYVAAQPLAAGSRVTGADLSPAHVRLGSASDLYLTGPVPAGGYVATRSVAVGEMVPVSALGRAAGAHTAAMVLTLADELPGMVAAGSIVDVWAAPKTTATAYGPPEVLVTAATVVRIVPGDGLISSGDRTRVELRVPSGDVARVLQSVAGGDQISAVSMGEPLR